MGKRSRLALLAWSLVALQLLLMYASAAIASTGVDGEGAPARRDMQRRVEPRMYVRDFRSNSRDIALLAGVAPGADRVGMLGCAGIVIIARRRRRSS
jgi:hypothetical protein